MIVCSYRKKQPRSDDSLLRLLRSELGQTRFESCDDARPIHTKHAAESEEDIRIRELQERIRVNELRRLALVRLV